MNGTSVSRARARRGFTLIELLIVIAIIAILALIAIPNFLEAQMRSRISRILADQRSVATAIEAYTVDHGNPPYYWNANDGLDFGYSHYGGEITFVPYRLTTPVAYISSLPSTPIQAEKTTSEVGLPPYTYFYRYFWPLPRNQWKDYPGPGTRGSNAVYGEDYARIAKRVNKAYDCYYHQGWYVDENAEGRNATWMLASAGPDRQCQAIMRAQAPQYKTTWNNANWPSLRYDPTNGTVSKGDILRFSGK